MNEPLLTVQDLRVSFGAAPSGAAAAVRGVDLTIERGEIMGLVGESGSGKSATLKALMRLMRPPVRIEGRVVWKGRDLLTLPADAMNAVRGRGIAMIFQEPMTALNPILSVGLQIGEVLQVHRRLDRAARRRETIRLLDRVGIASAERRLGQYPHELSGGMRQRVMIAIALAAAPELLLADEPTTALDVSIQDQVLVLLRDLVRDLGMAMILVTHDLGVVAETCERLGVMYAGRIVETGTTEQVFSHPRHSYTAALLRSVPDPDGPPRTRLPTIRLQADRIGTDGCAFAPRCDDVMSRCREIVPPMASISAGHRSACFAADRLAEREP